MKHTISLRTFTPIFLCLAMAFASCSQKQDEIPALLERTATIKYDADKKLITSAYEDAKAALQNKPDDMQQYINLASAFIAEGRVTGNSGYYNNAALKMLEHITAKENASPEFVFQALTLQSTILLNYHQFQDALTVAEKGVSINNYNSGIYGALIDANVELGNYSKAVQYCDKMLTLRPDLRSYSRASYLRQLYGENKAAIEAMTMAVEAGLPGAENTEWARTTLGDLYLNNGNPDSASIIYRTALVYRPGYPFALIGMAKVAKAKKDYSGAIAHTRDAIKAYSDASFILQLSELYALQGDDKKAKEINAEVIALIEDGEQEEKSNKYAKHNVNRELATAYMQAGQLDKAMGRATTDLEMRPANIDANTLVAWIYYLRGDYTNAKLHIDKAFVTGIKNADILYKAAAIYEKAGIKDKSTEMMQEALAINPYIKESFGTQARYAMATIN